MKRKQKQTDKKRKWLTLFVFFFLFLLFLKLIFVFKGSLWNGNDRVNILISQEDAFFVMTLEPKEPLLTVLKVPGNLYLEVPYGYGQYQAKSLRKLQELEKKPNLALKTMQENLAVFLDGEIAVKSFNPADKKETEQKLLGLLAGAGKTNFSRWDILRLWWKVKTLKKSEYKYLELEKMALLTRQKLADKSEVYLLDQANFDMKMQKIVLDPIVRLENLTIEILNGTDHQGLAEKAARILTNTGMSVVSTGNLDQKKEKTSVETAKKLAQSRTMTLVKKILNCSWQEKTTDRRADVTIVIGEDYYLYLSQK